MILPRHVRSGRTPKTLLSATGGGAESRDHFVEDQQHAFAIADRAQAGQESFAWRDQPHVSGDRFDDEGGDLAAMVAHDLLD